MVKNMASFLSCIPLSWVVLFHTVVFLLMVSSATSLHKTQTQIPLLKLLTAFPALCFRTFHYPRKGARMDSQLSWVSPHLQHGTFPPRTSAAVLHATLTEPCLRVRRPSRTTCHMVEGFSRGRESWAENFLVSTFPHSPSAALYLTACWFGGSLTCKSSFAEGA